MYLHLGKNTVVTLDEIIGIFDLDTTTVVKASRDYLARSEKNGEVINVSYDLPKSFVVCSDRSGVKKKHVYISPISTTTLLKRLEDNLI